MQLPNATYRVLQGIKEGLNLTQIAKLSGLNKSTISRKIKQLTREKLITSPFRTSYKALEMTPAGKRLLIEMQQVLRVSAYATSKTTYPIRFRWHNLLFRIPILKANPDINKQLEEAGFKYGRKRAFVRGWEMTIEGSPVFFTTKSFQIFPKPIWAGNLELAIKKGCLHIALICQKLQQMFPYLQMAAKTELCRQHIAQIGGITIKIPAGFRYRSETFEVDFSTGEAEMESVNSTYATEHMRNICAFLDDIGKGELIEQ